MPALTVLVVAMRTVVLLGVILFVIWGVVTLGFVARRRRMVALGEARSRGLLTGDVPDGRPLSSIKGGAWIGGMGVSWPFAVLEFFPSDVVVRSPQGVFQPLVIPRGAIGRLRIDRGVLGVSLKVEDEEGSDLDFSFRAFRCRSLREALSRAGWLGMLAG